MVEGMWLMRTAQFDDLIEQVAPSIVVLETNRLFGGDSVYYYIGDYVVEGGRITGSVRSRSHTVYPGMMNVFGIEGPVDYIVDFEAQLDGELITGSMSPRELPGQSLRLHLTKLAELP